MKDNKVIGICRGTFAPCSNCDRKITKNMLAIYDDDVKESLNGDRIETENGVVGRCSKGYGIL